MNQREIARRIRRRFEIKYGPEKPQFTGYSANVSRTGVMLRALRVFPPGTILHVQVKTPEGCLNLRGKVKWAREGSVQMLATGRVGMGIKWIDLTEEFLGWLDSELGYQASGTARPS